MILDIPRFKCFVDKKFVTDGEGSGFVEAYCFAVTLLENRPLLFTVHTIHGAVYSRLPIWALYGSDLADIAQPQSERDPWGAISSQGGVIEHQYLKDYHVQFVAGDFKGADGRYLFTIDYFSGGFSQDPEQHKCSHIVLLDSGIICAAPNNYLLFKDLHFVEEPDFKYRRNRLYYTL